MDTRYNISNLYDVIERKDKISRIYDLYNGIINKKNDDVCYMFHAT